MQYTSKLRQWVTIGDACWLVHERVHTFDAIGSPLSDGLRTYTWVNGREMHSVTQDGTTWFMAYNGTLIFPGVLPGLTCIEKITQHYSSVIIRKGKHRPSRNARYRGENGGFSTLIHLFNDRVIWV